MSHDARCTATVAGSAGAGAGKGRERGDTSSLRDVLIFDVFSDVCVLLSAPVTLRNQTNVVTKNKKNKIGGMVLVVVGYWFWVCEQVGVFFLVVFWHGEDKWFALLLYIL